MFSHCYVMKLHRHTSHENDEIRSNKWPQFVQDDVGTWWWYIYVMNHQYVYTAETA